MDVSSSLYPQNEIGLSIYSSVVLCSFVLVYIVIFWYSVCVHPLYVLQPLFLVLFYFLYWIICSRFFPLIHWFFSLSSFVIPSKCLKNFICFASKLSSSLFFSTRASLPNFNAALAVMLWICSIYKIFNFDFTVISYHCIFTSLSELWFSLCDLLTIHITKVCQYVYLGLWLLLFA